MHRATTHFVRIKDSSKILSHLVDGESVKILALPKLGTSSVCCDVYHRIQEREQFSIVPFLLHSSYTLEEIISQLLTSIGRLGLEIDAAPILSRCKSLPHVITQLADNMIPRLSNGHRLLFIFDDFSKNFKSKRPKSLLDEGSIISLRNLAEYDARTLFMVTYTKPVDAFLEDDWYLNNFRDIELEFLNKTSAVRLIEFTRGGSPIDSLKKKDLTNIKLLGGRHPFLLNNISSMYTGPESIRDCEGWLRRRYVEIQKHIEKESVDANGVDHVLAGLQLVARQPQTYEAMFPRHAFAFEFTHFSHEAGGYVLFSEHYANYLRSQSKGASKWNGIFARDLITSAVIGAVALIGLPITINASNFLASKLLQRPFFVYEFDAAIYRISRLEILFLDSCLLTLVATSIGSLILPVARWAIRNRSRPFFHFNYPFSSSRQLHKSSSWMRRVFGYIPFSVAAIVFLILVAGVACSVHRYYHPDSSRRSAQEAIAAYRNVSAPLSVATNEEKLRIVWFHLSGLRSATHLEEYLLIAPLVVGVRDNFDSARRLEGRELSSAWLKFVGSNARSQSHRPNARSLKNLANLVRYGARYQDLWQEYGRLLAFSLESQAVASTMMDAANRLGYAPSESQKRVQNFMLLAERCRLLASYLYVNLRSALVTDIGNQSYLQSTFELSTSTLVTGGSVDAELMYFCRNDAFLTEQNLPTASPESPSP